MNVLQHRSEMAEKHTVGDSVLAVHSLTILVVRASASIDRPEWQNVFNNM